CDRAALQHPARAGDPRGAPARAGNRGYPMRSDRGQAGQRLEPRTVYADVSSFNVRVCQGNNRSEACPPGVSVPDAPSCENPTTPVVIVNVQGCVPYLMNMFALGTPYTGGGRGFTVNRSVWFRDEKRG